MPPSIVKRRLQELQLVKKVTKCEKKSTKTGLPLCSNTLPLQWVFLGQIAYYLCPFDYDVSIICVEKKNPCPPLPRSKINQINKKLTNSKPAPSSFK